MSFNDKQWQWPEIYDDEDEDDDEYDERIDRERQKAEAKAEAAREKKNKLDSVLLKEAAKIIAGLESKKLIKLKLIHRLMLDETHYAISRYLKKESIPPHYSKIVESHNCIEVLIKGFFYMICKIKYSSSLDLKIAQLYEAIKKNNAQLIVYDRVSLIQKFIHGEMDRLYGEGSCNKIPANHMRILLSVSRLHLNLSDLTSKDESYSVYIDELSMSAANFEYFNPRVTELREGQHFIPRWRVRHIKPLSYFYTKSKRLKIARIYNLDEQLPLEEYSQAALEIYAIS